MKTLILKQSRNWWQNKDINWFIENAEFAFTEDRHHGNRVRIKTKKMLDGRNVFEFDNDRYGIMITSESEFTLFTEKSITGKSLTPIVMLVDFLHTWGAGGFVNPQRRSPIEFIKDLFSNRKDKLISITTK